jgi:hypothetical protein
MTSSAVPPAARIPSVGTLDPAICSRENGQCTLRHTAMPPLTPPFPTAAESRARLMSNPYLRRALTVIGVLTMTLTLAAASRTGRQ